MQYPAALKSIQQRANVEAYRVVLTHHILFSAYLKLFFPFSAMRVKGRILQTKEGKGEEE